MVRSVYRHNGQSPSLIINQSILNQSSITDPKTFNASALHSLASRLLRELSVVLVDETAEARRHVLGA
jgi:hypothetical protein